MKTGDRNHPLDDAFLPRLYFIDDEQIIDSWQWTGRTGWHPLPWQHWRHPIFLLKLRVLRTMWDRPHEWYREVWQKDANDQMCCDGHMCGCQGASYEYYWEYLTR